MSSPKLKQGQGPEWNAAYAPDLLQFLRISPLQVPDQDQFHFLLGAFLADVHARGYSFTDMHPQNVGFLPTGGFTVLDPGGWFEVKPDPLPMAGDFVVPALSLNPPQFGAFVSGYLFTTAKVIDPVYKDYSDRIAGLLTGTEFHYGSSYSTSIISVANALEAAVSGGPEIVLGKEEACAAFMALAISSFCWEYSSPPDLHRAIQRLLPQSGGALPAQVRIHDLLERGYLEPLRDAGYAEPSGMRPISEHRGPKVKRLPGRPKSDLLAALLSPLDSPNPAMAPVRRALLLAMGALLALCNKDGISETGTLGTYLTVAFGAAGTDKATSEELEASHRLAWSLFTYSSTFAELSPDSVRLQDPSNALELGLLFHKASYLDRLIFEKSLSDLAGRKSEEPRALAWYAGLSSIDSNRKSLLLLYYTVVGMEDRQPVPGVLLNSIYYSIQLKRTNEMRLATMAAERELTNMFSILGAGSKLIKDGYEWAGKALERIEAGGLSVPDLRSLLAGGLEYFAYVDLEVKAGDDARKHSRQDVWHGFGKTFSQKS